MTLHWPKISQLLIIISVVPLCFTETTYYVTPSPDTPCPREPCHTLSQYADQYFQNFSSNATLVFLPGDHILNDTISMGSISKYIEHMTATYIPKYNYSHPSLTRTTALTYYANTCSANLSRDDSVYRWLLSTQRKDSFFNTNQYC